MALSWNDMRMFLGPEVNAAVSVAEGEDPMAVMGNYAIGQGINYGVNSGADALHGATENVDAATNNVNPALESKPVAAPTEVAGPMPQAEMAGPMQPEVPVNQAFPGDTSLSNQANIRLDDNTIPGPQFEGYNGDVTSPANKTVEEPGTFLGLEGKDYTKMGMQGVMAAGVGALKPTQQVQSAAPAGPGITKGTVMQPQGGMQGVNSMTQPVNSMQMTQAQGLISPFKRDRYRRGQY
jgi:hypothetical protein